MQVQMDAMVTNKQAFSSQLNCNVFLSFLGFKGQFKFVYFTYSLPNKCLILLEVTYEY